MRGDNIAMRLRALAVQIIRIGRKLPKNDFAAKHIERQLVRSATAGGANYEEARGAESDFIHKVGIANKEVRETVYWLRLIDEASLVECDVATQLREANELVAILTASIKTAKRHAPSSENRE